MNELLNRLIARNGCFVTILNLSAGAFVKFLADNCFKLIECLINFYRLTHLGKFYLNLIIKIEQVKQMKRCAILKPNDLCKFVTFICINVHKTRYLVFKLYYLHFDSN